MHYDSKAFGYGKITIETLDKNMQNVIGQRKGFSESYLHIYFTASDE